MSETCSVKKDCDQTRDKLWKDGWIDVQCWIRRQDLLCVILIRKKAASEYHEVMVTKQKISMVNW